MQWLHQNRYNANPEKKEFYFHQRDKKSTLFSIPCQLIGLLMAEKQDIE